MSAPRAARSTLLLLLALWLSAAPAFADGHLSMQGGVFVPFQGDAGGSVLLQMLGSNASAKARFGGEFEYRQFDSKIIEVRDVDVETYAIRAVWQQHFMPDRALTPYLGLALGVVITDVDDGKVDAVKGRNVRSATGAGPDGLFMLGLDVKVPGADFLSIYGEGRVGFSFELIGREDASKLEVENLGGFSGSGGLRFRF